MANQASTTLQNGTNRYIDKPERVVQDLSKLDVVGNALGLPHFGDARNYADMRPTARTELPPEGTPYVTNADGTRTYSNGQTVAVGPDGSMTALANGNVAEQTAAAFNRAAGLYNRADAYDAREANAFNREEQLAGHLNALAHGEGPTVAGTQLAIGLDQAGKQQLAQAAGASGNNAVLARMGAMNNTANLQAQTNQQQALARAAEAATARSQLGAVTGNMVNQSQGAAGQKLNSADALNTLAMKGQVDIEDTNAENEKANSAADQGHKDKILDSFSSVVGKVAGI